MPDPFGYPPPGSSPFAAPDAAYDPMSGALIGGDLGRTEPEAYPNKLMRATIQTLASKPKEMVWDFPMALGDAVARMPLPGAERTPESDEAMQNAAGQSFMAALQTAGTSMPFAPHGAAGIFGGRLAKTADLGALDTAEKMHAAGADKRAIWDQTGWFRGDDGKWRFEIPDDQAQMHPDYYQRMRSQFGPVAGEIWHPELYKAYPDLRGTTAYVRETENTAGGSYAPPGASRSGDEEINIRAPNAGIARSVGLHELQHGVQEREGFAGGGNPAMFTQAEEAGLARDALAWRREMERFPGSPSEKDAAAAADYHAMGATDWIPSKEARDVARYPEDNPEPVLSKLVELYGLDKNISPHTARDLYHSIPGEIEARNVQARQDMTPAERAAKPPWETLNWRDTAASSPALNSIFGPRVGLLEGGQASRAMSRAIPDDMAAWFGKSKIVDEAGAPRVAYKAMDGDVPNIQGDTGLTHVALNRGIAEQFSGGGKRPVREVYVKAENPFDYRNPEHLSWLSKEMSKPENVAAFNRDTKKLMGPEYDFEHDARDIQAGLEEGAYQKYETPVVSKLIKSRGHDAIYMTEDFQAGEPNLAVFDPTQIKSVNSKRFDPKNPSIVMSIAPENPR